MSRFHRGALAALALVVALAGCGGGGGGASVPAARTPSPGASASAAPSGVTTIAMPALSGAQPLGAASLDTIALDIVLKARDRDGLLAYAQSVADPASALYRQFLTPQQIADRFGASADDQALVVKALTDAGLAVTTWPQRFVVHAVGRQADVERFLHTTYVRYSNGSTTFYAPASPPFVAQTLPIAGILNLADGLELARRAFVSGTSGINGGGLFGGYAPQQVAAAFDYTGAYNAGFTGSGITVGIIGTGPVQLTESGRIGDVDAFRAQFQVRGNGRLVRREVSSSVATQLGHSPTAPQPPVTPPCTGSLPGCNPEDTEAQLDTETIASLAPDADVYYYYAYVPNECLGGSTCYGPRAGIREADIELQQAIANNEVDVLTISFGSAEANALAQFSTDGVTYDPRALWPTLLAALGAEGIAVFAATGDAGAQACARPYTPGKASNACVTYPASDPNAVAVGGVNVPVDSTGRYVGPITAWGITTNGVSGGGGGFSAYVPRPAWQTGANIAGSVRSLPDLSLLGDPQTAVAVETNADSALGGGKTFGVGGTSAATPEMSAMWALVLQACSTTPSCRTASGPRPWRLGAPGPKLYALYNTPATYASAFYDVTFGNNGSTPCKLDPANPLYPCPTASPSTGYTAGTGYDTATGIGVPFARALIKAVVGI